eukprot:scaffold4433_cov35-Tisochrysis_lutea.AAC.7
MKDERKKGTSRDVRMHMYSYCMQLAVNINGNATIKMQAMILSKSLKRQASTTPKDLELSLYLVRPWGYTSPHPLHSPLLKSRSVERAGPLCEHVYFLHPIVIFHALIIIMSSRTARS